MSGDLTDPTRAFRDYLEATAETVPKTLISVFAILLIACARECAEADRVPSEDRNWEYLIQRIAIRAQYEIEHQSDPEAAVHILAPADLSRSDPSDLVEALVPVGDRLLKYFESYGNHHLGNLPTRSMRGPGE